MEINTRFLSYPWIKEMVKKSTYILTTISSENISLYILYSGGQGWKQKNLYTYSFTLENCIPILPAGVKSILCSLVIIVNYCNSKNKWQKLAVYFPFQQPPLLTTSNLSNSVLFFAPYIPFSDWDC
jgi:hypothetical protein